MDRLAIKPSPTIEPGRGGCSTLNWILQADPDENLTMVRGPTHVTYRLDHWDNALTFVPSPEVPNVHSRITFDVAGGSATALDLGSPPGANLLQRVG